MIVYVKATPRKDGKYQARYNFESGKQIKKILTREKVEDLIKESQEDNTSVIFT